MAWTDERMDDLASRMDAGFERTDNDIRNLSRQMDERFERADSDIRELAQRIDKRFERTDRDIRDLGQRMDKRFERTDADIRELRGELRGDIEALRTLTTRFGIAIVVSLVGVIATLVSVTATGAIAG